MNLTIDVGNSAIKVGFFNNGVLKRVSHIADFNNIEYIEGVNEANIIFSSVTTLPDYLLTGKAFTKNTIILDNRVKLPFLNKYRTPDTLGSDRLAAIAGARIFFPESNCLVIDIGTCITYDLIDKDGNYEGGSISPGTNIRFRALHEFTAKLPKLKMPEKSDTVLTGKDTYESIMSGVINGTIAELNGIATTYKKMYNDLQIVVCGGDAVFFENKLEGVFVIPDLVHYGLNTILEYNL